MERNTGEGNNQPNTFAQNNRSEVQLPQRYRFSPEEIRVLKECNRESFWFRSLPVATGLSSVVYFAIKGGYLAANLRWGAFPKMFSAAVVGYFIGKVSYQTKCMEKIMQLPNSSLAEHLRKQKGRLGFQEVLTFDPGFASASPMEPGSQQSLPDTHVYTDVMDTRAMSNFDTESSNYVGVDYGKQVDSTEQMLNDENMPTKRQQFATTYDDLRRQNRIDYETAKHPSPSHHPLQQQQQPHEPMRRPNPNVASREPLYTPKRNIYGDIWEDAGPEK